MGGLTAIELGPDTCTMVRTSLRGADVRVLDVETLDPAAFPGTDAFVGAVRQARRAKKLPRRAHVVLWGLPDGATPRDPGIEPLLAPLKRAGFRIQRVVSPCNALAALSRLRAPRADGAVAWLAVNRGGVAIAVVRPGTLLHAHEFPWDSSVGATGSQARLLQRYSLVAFLAPEVRRAMAVVASRGARVDAVVTCGNLPDLRSLTMPLIEELDLEVETLDSLDGLALKPALRDRLADAAPALRVACAGAVARASRPRGRPQRLSGGTLFRTAALVVAAAGIAWLWLGSRAAPPARPAQPASSTTSARPPQTAPPERQSVPPPQQPVPPPQPHTPVAPAAPQASPAAQAANPAASAPTLVAPAAKPAASTPVAPVATTVAPQHPGAAPAPTTSVPPAGRASRLMTTPAPQPKPAAPAANPPARPKVQAPTPPPAPVATVVTTPARTDKPEVGQSPPRRAATVPAERLKDALPHITTILVSAERRFAVLDGRTVTVGDTVGQRVVAAIEPRAVVLREPSGVQIRVGLGGRFLGVEPARR